MERVLVYHTGALGDFVTLLPALKLLRAIRPQAVVTLLGRPSHGELARQAGLVDVVLDCQEARYRSLYDPASAAAAPEAIGGVNRALLLTASADLAAAFRSMVPVVDALPPLPPPGVWAYGHRARFFASALGVDPDRSPEIAACLAPPLLALRGAAREAAGARELWLHPGAGNPRKCWPPARYAELARALRRATYRVHWSLGPADEGLTPERIGVAPGEPVSRNEPPAVLASGLARASAYVGGDTGVTHLAAAVGCPVVALFGPTDDEVWRPHGSSVRVITRRGVCREGGAACPPGRPDACLRLLDGYPACLARIDASAVLSELESLWPDRRCR